MAYDTLHKKIGTPRPALAGVVLATCALAASRGLSGEILHIDGGQKVEGELLKETEEQLFVDLGFTVLAVPKKRVVKRESAEAAGQKSAEGTGEGGLPSAAGREESIYFTRTGEKAPIRRHAEASGDAVVQITTPSGLGSGFVVSPKEGYIVTNHHVIEREQKITVTFFLRKGTEYQKVSKEKVRIVAINPFLDLAVLKIDDLADLKLPQLYLSAGDDELRVGDPVFAIGNPLGLERSVSEGIVSKTDREIEGMLYIQTTAAINPGNSGGPLFDDRGDIVGITNMKAVFGEALGFAIPVEVLKDFLKHRSAFAYDKDNPNSGYRYLPPPRRDQGGQAERKL